MGRQTQLHLLEEDCREFLHFLHEHDPVVVLDWDSDSPEIMEVLNPCQRGGIYCLWNQAVLASMDRKQISGKKSYYRVDSALPVIEFSYPAPVQEAWNGRPALTQGRIWAGIEGENKAFEKWYNATVRWIRKNFIKSPVPLDGFLGRAAYSWYKKGGTLLPMLRPPVTPQWVSWVEAQDQQRSLFK